MEDVVLPEGREGGTQERRSMFSQCVLSQLDNPDRSQGSCKFGILVKNKYVLFLNFSVFRVDAGILELHVSPGHLMRTWRQIKAEGNLLQ